MNQAKRKFASVIAAAMANSECSSVECAEILADTLAAHINMSKDFDSAECFEGENAHVCVSTNPKHNLVDDISTSAIIGAITGKIPAYPVYGKLSLVRDSAESGDTEDTAQDTSEADMSELPEELRAILGNLENSGFNVKVFRAK